jgi:hypothetical protein
MANAGLDLIENRQHVSSVVTSSASAPAAGLHVEQKRV